MIPSKIILISFLFLFTCKENKISKPIENVYALPKNNFEGLYTTGGIRNGIRSIEGIELSKKGFNTYSYRFSIVNWRDKFEDIDGSFIVDSTSNFSIKSDINVTDVAAIKLIDTSKKDTIIFGLEKKKRDYGRLYKVENNQLINLVENPLFFK